VPCESTAALSDAEILRQTAAGDHQVFEVFVARHEAAVHRYVRTLLQEPDRVDDVLQETFIAAWRGAGDFRGAGSARSWLLRIGRNAVLRQHRRHVGEPRAYVALHDLAREAGWGESGGSGVTDRLAARESVAAGFRGLKAAEREILILRDLEQFTGEEAAATLGITLAAQKSRLNRARLHFIANLKAAADHD
jgi:RNA polymerase sigma-70 factor (ECF subfamily)